MPRHPLNLSINDRMERDPKTVLLVDAIVGGRLSPTIDLYDLADHPDLNFDDRYLALAYMRHACRIIVGREKFCLLLVTFDSQACLGQVDRSRGETTDECGFALSKIAADYVRQCTAANTEIEPLDIIAMPLSQYKAEHGMVADQYGVSLGSYSFDYLEGMQAALSLLLADAA